MAQILPLPPKVSAKKKVVVQKKAPQRAWDEIGWQQDRQVNRRERVEQIEKMKASAVYTKRTHGKRNK